MAKVATLDDVQDRAERHTPGPWLKLPRCAYGWDIYADDIWIGTGNADHGLPGVGFPTNEKGEANANLIAAAPVMKAELKRLFEKYGEQQTADVLAKATGDTRVPPIPMKESAQ